MTHRLAAAIPDCEAVVVPDARHMLPVERPRRTRPTPVHLRRKARPCLSRKTLQHFIDGKPAEPESGEYFASTNPANREVLYEAARGNAADVDAAVRSARAGLRGSALA